MEEETQQTPGLISKDGVMVGALTRDRVLVLPAKFWTDVKIFLERAYGRAINVALSHIAEEFGMSYAEKMENLGLDQVHALESLSQMAVVAGWGKVSIAGDTRTGEAFQVEVIDCAFCPMGQGIGDRRCDFVAGVATGVAKSLYRSEYVCNHARVELGTERRCTLSLKKRSEPDKTSWKTTVHFPWMIEGK